MFDHCNLYKIILVKHCTFICEIKATLYHRKGMRHQIAKPSCNKELWGEKPAELYQRCTQTFTFRYKKLFSVMIKEVVHIRKKPTL